MSSPIQSENSASDTDTLDLDPVPASLKFDSLRVFPNTTTEICRPTSAARLSL